MENTYIDFLEIIEAIIVVFIVISIVVLLGTLVDIIYNTKSRKKK